MAVSNRVLFVAGCAAATLAFCGGGVGASFTSTANANASVTLGVVKVGLGTGGTGCGQPSCAPTYSNSNGNGQDKDWTYAATDGGFSLDALSGVGSHFHASVPMKITNTGNLTLRSISLSVTDPAHADDRLAQETMTTVTAAGGTVYTGTLADLVDGGTVDLSAALGEIAPGGVTWFIVTLSAPPGGYADSAPSTTIAPSFTVTGSDI